MQEIVSYNHHTRVPRKAGQELKNIYPNQPASGATGIIWVYKIIEQKRLSEFKSKLINYYNRYFPKESNSIVVPNSSVFFAAFKNGEIVGACRIITDFSRYALLLDLIVRKKERRKGIGTQLAKLACQYCQKKRIKKLILTTDPRLNWLTKFYTKLGFKKIKNQTLMQFSS